MRTDKTALHRLLSGCSGLSTQILLLYYNGKSSRIADQDFDAPFFSSSPHDAGVGRGSRRGAVANLNEFPFPPPLVPRGATVLLGKHFFRRV